MIALMETPSPELRRLRKLERAVRALIRQTRAHGITIEKVDPKVIRDLIEHSNSRVKK